MLVAFSDSHNEGIMYFPISEKVCYLLEKKNFRNAFMRKILTSNQTLFSDSEQLLAANEHQHLQAGRHWVMSSESKGILYKFYTDLYFLLIKKFLKYTWFTMLC